MTWIPNSDERVSEIIVVLFVLSLHCCISPIFFFSQSQIVMPVVPLLNGQILANNKGVADKWLSCLQRWAALLWSLIGGQAVT